MGVLNVCKKFSSIVFQRNFSSKAAKMKILNVAEKNDAAKNIAMYLSRGNSRRREGLSPYNKIYEFNAQVLGQDANMVMTSVSGHLLTYAFVGAYKGWTKCNPLELFKAPVIKECPEDYIRVRKTLEREVRSCDTLIIWTDCDREGENIGFEIIDVCKAIKPRIKVYRAIFSEITAASVFRALNNLGPPDQRKSDAVNVRSELDLRIGAAFTRLQTLRLKQVFPTKLAENLISYGSCQFPTLGFVVDRFKAIEDFVEQTFWRIKVLHTIEELTVEFRWGRDRLFDKELVEAILERCLENQTATVKKVISKPKSKWRPVPLDTIEMEKSASRKLKLTAKRTMQIAESLYTKGLISYPRTETNIFPKDLNLTNLIEQQTGDQQWGNFANRILESGGPTPRQGKKSDQAHPPIHPIKYAADLTGDDKAVYEFIVRHFLACCSKDAQGMETVVDIEIMDEAFQAKGLMIIERNYLEVYKYEKWNAKEIHIYQENQTFIPTVMELAEGNTSPPPLLTEADLIALMEKHGIGTDATHAEHIAKIQEREYVGVTNGHFVPGLLGMGLVEGYDHVGLEVSLAKPNLRSELENDLQAICDGRKQPEVVLREQVNKYEAVYRKVLEHLGAIDEAIGARIDEQPVPNVELPTPGIEAVETPFKCPKCDNPMRVNLRKNNTYYIGCTAFPGCNNAVWLPSDIKKITVTNNSCPTCGPGYKILKFEFVRMSYGCHSSPLFACIGGCDPSLLEDFDIRLQNVKKVAPTNQVNQQNSNTRTIPNSQRPTPATNIRPTQERSNARPPPANTTIQNRSNVRTEMFPTVNNVNRNRPATTASPPPAGNDDNEILCACSKTAVLLTVRKEGPNIGRQFYKCPDGACNFFLWFTNEEPPTTASTSTFGRDANQRTEVDLHCICGEIAVKKTVQKEGPNKGRQFWACPKGMGNGCKFFKWDDEDNGGGGGDGWGGGGGGGGPGGGGGGWTNNRRKNSNDTTSQPAKKRKTTTRQTSGKRKCGNCGEEGHIRTKCPHR